MLLPVWSFYNNNFSNKNINMKIKINIKNNETSKILASHDSVNKNYKNKNNNKNIKLIELLKRHVDDCFKNIKLNDYKNFKIEYIQILNPN